MQGQSDIYLVGTDLLTLTEERDVDEALLVPHILERGGQTAVEVVPAQAHLVVAHCRFVQFRVCWRPVQIRFHFIALQVRHFNSESPTHLL